MSTRNTFLLFALLVALAIVGLRSLGGDTPKEFRRSRILMDTVVEITVTDAGGAPLPQVVDKAFDEMARIERLTSLFREGSDVARINAQRETEVAPETAAIVSLGLEVSRASGGAFDMTLGRLKMLWPMDGTQKAVPSQEAIRTALAGSGMDAIALRNGQVSRRFAETMVDLGGIAKGYAIDRAYETLKAAGVRQAAVNAGGDLRLLGGHGEKPWRIAIQHPRKPGGIVGALALRDVAVVTSGDYERFFELDGVRYHHLFDPHTGWPARASQSATVVAPSAALADALATAAFVLGPQKGIALLEKTPDAEGLIIGADGNIYRTAGLETAWEQ